MANISIPNFAFQRCHETYQKGQISVNKATGKKIVLISLFPLVPSFSINSCVSGSQWNFLPVTVIPSYMALYIWLVEVHKNIILEAASGSGLLTQMYYFRFLKITFTFL